MDQVVGLFPIPLMRVPGLLGSPLVRELVAHFSARALQANSGSQGLSHSELLRPADSPLFGETASLVAPKLAEFSVLLFGERLNWAIKEMWVNVLQTGGATKIAQPRQQLYFWRDLFDREPSCGADRVRQIAGWQRFRFSERER